MEGLAEDRRIKMVPAHWNNKLIDQLVAFTGEDVERMTLWTLLLALAGFGLDLEGESRLRI